MQKRVAPCSRASRAAGLERVLDYIAGHSGVWFTRRIDIARHWTATHPAPTPAD